MSQKIDLSLINSLVKELGKQLSIADSIDRVINHNDYIVEMGKALGLTASIHAEALALMGDIAAVTKTLPAESSLDLFGSLLPKKKTTFQ